MNLYLRLLWTVLRCLKLPAIEPGAWIERQLRVLPNDIDINGHMNNGRYLTLTDLSVIEYFVRCGFATAIIKAGWRPMSGGAFITYRKGLSALQSYRLRFRLAAADATWNYLRFEFLRTDGTLCAAGYMKGAVVSKAGFVGNAVSYARMNRPFVLTPLPAAVQQWLAAEAGVMDEVTGPPHLATGA